MSASFDMSDSIIAKSDQQNYDDYLGGPKLVTIAEVRGGTAEQPVEIHLAEYPGKPYKPSKSMRRVLVFAWGADASAYIGRKLKLYGDAEVTYGGKAVGGIKVEGMSHIDKPFTLNLTEKRGQKKPHHVEPLPDAPAPTPPITDTDATAFEQRIEAAATTAELDAVAADLKARDLGTHRKHLQDAYANRRDEIKQDDAIEATK